MKTISRKIKSLQDRLARLKQLSLSLDTFHDYENSSNFKDIAERGIQVSIEICLDIAKIIISREKLPEPKDNKGVFVVLAALG